MADGEAWRRKRAEELGLVDTGPWLGGAPCAGARAAAGGRPGVGDRSGDARYSGPAEPSARVPDPVPDEPAPASPAPVAPARIAWAAAPVQQPAPLPVGSATLWPAPATPVRGASRLRRDAATASGGARLALRSKPVAAALLLAAAASGWLLRDVTLPDGAAVPPPELAALDPSVIRQAQRAAAPGAPLPTTAREVAAGPTAEPVPEAASSSATDAASRRGDDAPRTAPTTAPAEAVSGAAPSLATAPPPARAPATADRWAQPASVSRDGQAVRTTAARAVASAGDRGRAIAASKPRRDARPSFNCRRAKADALQLVCGDRELARLDRRMAGLYGDVATRARGELAHIVDTDQTAFLNARNRCRSEACLADLYQARIADLGDADAELN